jgi:hypothetical protein
MRRAVIDYAVSRIAGDKDYQTQFMQAIGRGQRVQPLM